VGLIFLVGVLAIGPVSRRFVEWNLGFVGSLLSRIEAAAKYLVIAQARLMVFRHALDIDHSRFSDALARVVVVDEPNVSLAESRARLMRVRAMLLDLPRHAARLIRWVQKQIRCTGDMNRVLLCGDQGTSAPCQRWRLAAPRIERPPDQSFFAVPFALPPLGCPAGGLGG